MTFKRSLSALIFLVLVLILGVVVSAQDNITLTILTHWGEQPLLEAQQKMFDAYTAEHPNVTIELKTVSFNDLLTTIVTGRTAGTNPDIYHMYNLWLPDFIGENGLVGEPPAEVVDYVKANSPQGVIDGVTVAGKIWGVPTEVNTYLLLYNKKLLAEAGYDAPPATWDELKEMAAAITSKDDTGAVTQAGFAVIPGWDSGIVHPFTALLQSNGGSYMNEDATATAFNSEQGLETLQLYADLLASGGMDMSLNGMADFPNGRVGMFIMANWFRATVQNSEVVEYEDVGVAPVPVGPSGTETSTLSYNWLWSVDAGSPDAEAAWDFIMWMNTEHEEGQGSPMGDYLVHALGAIPSLLFDQAAFAEDLGDHFLVPFVESTGYARPEPVVAGGQEVKTNLQTEIEAMLNGIEDAQTALDIAAEEGDDVLAEMAGG